MKIRRILPMLLAFAMVQSLLAPAASAVGPSQADESASSWTVKPVESDAELPLAALPDCVQELRRAAEVYAAGDMVRAFVVMEEAPLSERFTSRTSARLADAQKLLDHQNRVIHQIENRILSDGDLKVRYQFTYLTNSFTIETPFGNLEQIAGMDGVRSVFVMPVYHPCTTEQGITPSTSSAAGMTGVTRVWQELGYTGAGMKIAVIDTGLDLDHPSFASDPVLTDASMTVGDIEGVLHQLKAFERRNGLTAGSLYYSPKIPFAFNYVDANLNADHEDDMQGDHGTHVAGIAAANAVEGTDVNGMAPDAQIIVMKVFGASGGAFTDDIVAAMEDAMVLGCDVINASLGAPAGFTTTDTEIDRIFQRLSEQDIVACFAGGNESTSAAGNLWGTDLSPTRNPDNATINQPGTYANLITVASADNGQLMADYLTLRDGTRIFYVDSVEGSYAAAGDPMYEGAVPMNTLAGTELVYVLVEGKGYAEDYYDSEGVSLVDGKVAVIQRGEITFAEKVFHAQYAGAVAAIIVDHAGDDIYSLNMSVADENGYLPVIPAVIIHTDSGPAFYEQTEPYLTVSAEQVPRPGYTGGQISDFSSWGVSPDLSLEPEITGLGGNVYSCLDGGGYGVDSGTSMATPQVAGITALVMQRLYPLFPDAGDGQIRKLAQALIMSTADPIVSDDGVPLSPRQQGAGLVNAYEATTSHTCLTVNDDMPKASMGDSATGDFRFTFTIHNFGDTAQSYTLGGVLMTERPEEYEISDTETDYFMSGQEMLLEGSITFDQPAVTVPAGGETQVTVTVRLSEEDKDFFAEYWENGGYVEGFVHLYDAGVQDLNLPFLGFYGDWTKAPVFDSGYWYDNGFWNEVPVKAEGDESWHVLWSSMEGEDWVPGINPYYGTVLDETGAVAYDPENAVLSPNGDGNMDVLTDIQLSLLRNARILTFTYLVDGQVMKTETISFNPKTMFLPDFGQVVPWYYTEYGVDGLYAFTDDEDNPLPNGTEVKLQVEATVDYGQGGDHGLEFTLYVDTRAPELVGITQEERDGVRYLMVEARDDRALASIFLMNPSGSRIYAQHYDFEMEHTPEGTCITAFDVTGLGTEFQIGLGDYGVNESFFTATYSAGDGNLPQLDTDLLYAYRHYDSLLYDESPFGWVSLDGLTADSTETLITRLTDDSMSPSLICAAEYAAGWIFAIDDRGNLLAIEPGLFEQRIICDLGFSALDMTFDDSTDTMYVLGTSGGSSMLYTLDLTSGEISLLADYGFDYLGPMAIADDDNGTLYAIQSEMSNLFTLDPADGYSLKPVIVESDGAWLELQIYDSWGNPALPNHTQSLTYTGGKLYWTYFTSDWLNEYSELIVIDTADWSSCALSYVEEFMEGVGIPYLDYPMTQLAGLLTLTETDYALPEATALGGLRMDKPTLALRPGQIASLSPLTDPWYYEPGEVVWSSSDEAVATVSGGMVTAVGGGTARISASMDGMTASCTVTVLESAGSFQAYNYYSDDLNYGTMVEVDLGTVDYTMLEVSPLDFMAGDYNGHEGVFYGYTDGGQLWRYDRETQEYTRQGQPQGTVPGDMAYDYSTGLMYATVTDSKTGAGCIAQVNLRTGELETVYETWDSTLMALACDNTGRLYSITNWGELYRFDYGYDPEAEAGQWIPTLLRDDLGEVYYIQSMCWDHTQQVLLWNCPDKESVIWIDPEQNSVLELGNPSWGGMMELVGMYTVPETIPDQLHVPVEQAEAFDLTLLVGATEFPAVDIRPLNATNRQVSWTSGDENVVIVNADGSLTGVGPGSTTVTGILKDGSVNHELRFTATVLPAADQLYGYVMSDLSTFDSQYWVRIYPEHPEEPETLDRFDYVVLAAEYVDGRLYACGYDPMDMESTRYFFVLDADSHEILAQYAMDEDFPSVYDMTYDHTTGTMFALAGFSEENTDLYVLDLQTGEGVLLLETEQNFLSIAAGADGTLYAMERSQQDFVEGGYLDAALFAIDASNLTIRSVGSTGLKSNMITSLAFDYDTGYLYWTPFLSAEASPSGLAIVDPGTGEAQALGTIGIMGSHITGLHFIGERYPEQDASTLKQLLLMEDRQTLPVGETFDLTALTIPSGVAGSVRWESSSEAVAAVDASGRVTARSPGRAEITAMLTVNGVTRTASCTVTVMDPEASYLSWNRTDGGWSKINRLDPSNVTNLSEVTGETEVTALTSVGQEVYGYDWDGQLFRLNLQTLERTPIGDGPGLTMDDGYQLRIRDMAYDAANRRMLVLGEEYVWNPDTQSYDPIWGGCSVYVADLTTGERTLLVDFPDHGDLRAMAVDEEGQIYLYCVVDDVIYKADPENGMTQQLTCLWDQMLFGNVDAVFSMDYDAMSGCLQLLFSSDNSSCQLHTIDAATGKVYSGDNVGDVNWDGWSDAGDLFAGLAALEAPGHSCDYLNGVCRICGSREALDFDTIDNPFVDVTKDAYYHESVLWAVHYGVTSGMTATTFDPNAICTRAQMMTFLWRTAGCPAPAGEENPFTDVIPGAYYIDAVLWAYEQGIANGVTETTFAPNAQCTRAQAVTFLYRWMGQACDGENPFRDVAPGDYFYDAVLWAVEEGITTGTSAETFAPNAQCTRGQIMTFLYRLWFA